MLTLYPHQQDALRQTENKNKCAYYLDMGLGKTFVGSEKMWQLGEKTNVVICQKSKVTDWIEHFRAYYNTWVYNLTDKKGFNEFMLNALTLDEDTRKPTVGVINYDIIFRRKELFELGGFTLMCDESSLIQNEKAKRTKAIMQLNYKNLIFLSGTPTGGKYEKLWSQLKMLGYNISKTAFYNLYVDYVYDTSQGFPLMMIKGYKNVERLKCKMRHYGCVFMKSDEVLDLPRQTFVPVKVDASKEYRKFRKDCVVTVGGKLVEDCGQSFHGGTVLRDGVELVGDTTLTKMLYERQLCGQYSKAKMQAFSDLVESTNDRLIVFYNFTAEAEAIINLCNSLKRPYSVVNGKVKDLYAYENESTSITLIQYQAGAMGLNLQKANKIVYFTPPLSSELYEQSKKRIHRIGQNKPCFYYNLICKNSIEEKIYRTLKMRKDYTEKLFESEGE